MDLAEFDMTCESGRGSRGGAGGGVQSDSATGRAGRRQLAQIIAFCLVSHQMTVERAKEVKAIMVLYMQTSLVFMTVLYA